MDTQQGFYKKKLVEPGGLNQFLSFNQFVIFWLFTPLPGTAHLVTNSRLVMVAHLS